MKLKTIETFTNHDVGFVRVTAEDGTQGWGQVSTYHSDITSQILHRQVAPWTLGQETTNLDDLLDIVAEREHKFLVRTSAVPWLDWIQPSGTCEANKQKNLWLNFLEARLALYALMLLQ